jgi:Protein of unknown function (DUF2878)
MPVAVNFVLFQIGWFTCVLGAAQGLPWLGVLVATAIAAWHVTRARRARLELVLLGLAAVAGVLFDTVLIRLGLTRFSAGVVLEGVTPYWMIALWVVFATTLNVSLRWLHQRLAIAGALGFVGGALAYYSAARLGAIKLAPLGLALPAIASGWAVLTPLLVALARRYDGFSRR